MERQAFEPTGLVPRSIIRTFDRFRQQLLPETKAAAVQEFRISRYQVLVSVKSLLSLVLVPLIINFLARTFLLNPATEYLWNTQQNEIFLNSYQEDRALREIHDFSEKVYFESLLGEEPAPITMAMHPQVPKAVHPVPLTYKRQEMEEWKGVTQPLAKVDLTDARLWGLCPLLHPEGMHSRGLDGRPWPSKGWPTNPWPSNPQLAEQVTNEPSAYLFDRTVGIVRLEPAKELQCTATHEAVANQFQDKAVELALIYNKESMLAITNVLGDFVTFVTIASLFVWMRPQIVILKSFLTESIYSLSDTTKSFLLILVTDLLVGFHSPRGWEIGIEMLLRHFGLPENQDFIFLFVAAFPVFLDTIFKYWIFRYLNKISPSTVATYHNMIE